MEELKRPEPAPPKKPNIVVRLLAFLLTLALVLGAVALVAFRDKINLDSLKRYITYRTLETGDDRQPTSFRLESGGKGGCLGVGDDLLALLRQRRGVPHRIRPAHYPGGRRSRQRGRGL